MNLYILEIAEEEKQILLDLLSVERKSLQEFSESPLLSNIEKQATSNSLAEIAGLEFKILEAPLAVGQG